MTVWRQELAQNWPHSLPEAWLVVKMVSEIHLVSFSSISLFSPIKAPSTSQQKGLCGLGPLWILIAQPYVDVDGEVLPPGFMKFPFYNLSENEKYNL